MIADPSRLASLPSVDLILEPPVSVADEQIEYGCHLISSNGESRRIWFRFPAQYGSMLTRRADPFVLATLLYLSGRFSRVHVEGVVSEALFPNLAEFQTAFSAFHREHPAPLRFSATEQAPPAGVRREVTGITAFSGGVDSCFSVYRHTALSSLEPKRALRAALMMHGFDIPLDSPEVFRRAAGRARALTDEAGLRLYTGSTNLRTLPGQWEKTFGTAVAAALAFFQPAHSFGLIPSFQDWTNAHFEHGSNPLTDPLLSSSAFAIVHDGAGFGRIDKLRHLAQWPAALRHLRVCWEGEALDANCCRCEKCIRTMLMLRICGVTETPAFPLPIEVAALDSLVIRNQSGLDEFAYLLREARRLGIDEPWMKPTARALRRNRRATRLWSRGRALTAIMPAGMRGALRDGARRVLWGKSRPDAAIAGAGAVSAGSSPSQR